MVRIPCAPRASLERTKGPGRSRTWGPLLAAALLACAPTPEAIAPDLGQAAPDAAISTDAASTDRGSSPSDAGSPDDAEPADLGTGSTLRGPAQVNLPFMTAGRGGASTLVTLRNDGDQALEGLSVRVSAGPFHLAEPPVRIAPWAEVQLDLQHPGATEERIDQAELTVESGALRFVAPIYAVVGDPAVGPANFEDVPLAQGQRAGRGVTIALPTAPFPSSGSPWTDARVRIFLPEDFRADRPLTVLLHFHGFSTTLEATLASHRYQEQVWASGANVALVVPQGPVSAQSGDFGKLMDPAGTWRLLRQITAVLFREGLLTRPALQGLILSAHSGGYQAVAANLDPILPVTGAELFDALYGYRSTFRGYVAAGGRLRSNYSEGGGTLDQNQALRDELVALGISVDQEGAGPGLAEAPAVITFAPTTHNQVTRYRGAYGEWLRYLAPGRRGPRVELLSVLPEGERVLLSWRVPRDPEVVGLRVERSDGAGWVVAADLAPDATGAELPLLGGGRFRVRTLLAGEAETLASDTYRADPDPTALVVDGFDRVIGGGHAGLAHDFAARVGEAWGPVATVGHRAIDEGTIDPSRWPLLVWLAGDQSRDDLSLTDRERTALTTYLAGGGRLLIAGSEVAYDLSARAPAFLTGLGASYLADAAADRRAMGAGPLDALGAFDFGGPGAPYAVGYPDVLGPTSGAVTLLRYPDGRAAAVGLPGRAALVGFPLETIDDPQRQAALLAGLRTFLLP